MRCGKIWVIESVCVAPCGLADSDEDEGPERIGELAAAIKARWVCEQAHQQLKEELGLGRRGAPRAGAIRYRDLSARVHMALRVS
jgi:hypothetical protein